MIRAIMSTAILFFSLTACFQEQEKLSEYETLADYDERIYRQQQKELNDIEKVRQCDFSNVILLQLFDAYVPIPNTYYFSNRRSEGEFNEFSRHPWQGIYTASMLTGSYEKLMQSSFSTIGTEIMEEFEEKDKLGELNVIKRKMKDVYSTDVIVLHDDSEFLMVKDSNNKLWKAMVDSYEFLRSKKCDKN